MSTAILPLTAHATALRAGGPPRASRDVTVDIARAWCLTVVVALHSLMVGVSVGAVGPVLQNALESWSWLPAFTWLAQIMPLFVVLGGFSSYTQWGRMRARGVRPGEYVAQRMQRLVRPAVVAVAAVLIVLAALTVAGVPPEIVATAGFRLSQPLWFLGVYILCTAFVPALAAAHRRAPVTTVGALASVVLAVDVVRPPRGHGRRVRQSPVRLAAHPAARLLARLRPARRALPALAGRDRRSAHSPSCSPRRPPGCTRSTCSRTSTRRPSPWCSSGSRSSRCSSWLALRCSGSRASGCSSVRCPR